MSKLIIDENTSVSELMSLIGKTVYVILKATEPDEFWGTIDCEPAKIIPVEIHRIGISSLGVFIIRGYSYPDDYNVSRNEIYLNKKDAEQRLKEIKGE